MSDTHMLASNELVTHIIRTGDGDNICYAYKVCAAGDDGAIPVHFGPPAHVPVAHDMVVRLMEAVEGECDGLAIDVGQALAILAHVLSPDAIISSPERCQDCDGYNCDDGCAYPDASKSSGIAPTGRNAPDKERG